MTNNRIMLVEDEEITLFDLETSLKDMGYEVIGIAKSGLDAISMAKEKIPDLIIIDIILKGDMDGIEAATEINSNLEIPVIYLTAHGDYETLERAKKTGPFGYIIKPFKNEELNGTIQMALSKHEAELELRKNSDELILIANSVHDAIITSNENGNILFWNAGAKQVFGYDESEVIGKPLTILMPKQFQSSHDAGIKRVAKSGHSKLAGQILELEAARKNGEIFPIEMSLSTWKTGKSCYFAAVIRDISERKILEEKEQYAAFQSGVAEMSVTILHNIGNAIMGISHRASKMVEASRELQQTGEILGGMKSLLEKKRTSGMSDQEILSELEKILPNVGERLQELTKDVFAQNSQTIADGVEHISEIIKLHQDASHQETNSVQFKINTLFDNAIAIQVDDLQKCKIKTSVTIDPKVRNVCFPRNQLLQLMINLIKNSREAIQKRMETESLQGGEIGIIVALRGDNLEIRVKDNGCGINPEIKDSIFQHGFSTRKRGTGFGLHSAANFVQSLHGTIHIESDGVNQGAEMVVNFPDSCLE
ncbi:MAG: PAS domain S-box protein [Magnetococcales bacterium]|nr:PAS domain S-box protein [Magnetococcales bacterium]